MKLVFTFLLISLSCGQISAQDRGIGTPMASSAERRLALVIGMNEYQHVNRLKNPSNDADDMKTTLEKLGFTVTIIKNKTKVQCEIAIQQFLSNLRPKDIVLCYFSGHGIGYLGDNYLLPVDAQAECLEQIGFYTLSVNRLLADIQNKQVNNNFVFLDACRSIQGLKVCESSEKFPTTPKGHSIPLNQLPGQVVVYATQAGHTADDNIDARNGLFTQELLKFLNIPNLTLGEILINTAESVVLKSQAKGKRQEPTVYGLLGLKFKFFINYTKEDSEQMNNGEIENPTAKVEIKKSTPPDVKKKFLDIPLADMVFVEGGLFEMGSLNGDADEKPVHPVKLNGFWIGKYEITQAQWRVIMGGDPESLNNRGCDSCPVEGVSWDDIHEFLRLLNLRTGGNYRLPTEAEWEYAARGGKFWRDGFAYLEGKDFSQVAGWFSTNFRESKHGTQGTTHPVGTKNPNPLGIFDMCGNVWEYCSDWYAGDWYDQPAARQPNPENTNFGTKKYRVVRGGSWYSAPNNARVANRNNDQPYFINLDLGFRVVVSQVQ